MKRRRMLAWSLAAASIAAGHTPTHAQARDIIAPKSLSIDSRSVDVLVDAAMRTFGTPGISVGIVKDGELVFAKGYGVGDIGNPAPVTP